MMKADTSTLTMRLRVMMLSFTFRGGFLITSLSTGSTPKLERSKRIIETTGARFYTTLPMMLGDL